MQQVTALRHGIAWHRSKTWYWQNVAGRQRTPTEHAERRTSSVAYLEWMERLWSHRRIAAYRYAHTHPLIAHRALWLCIHSREAQDWHNEDTGHNGHYGGLQMSLGWDGLVGNAALLSPTQQMVAAETGYRRSGFSRSWLLGQWYHPDCLAYA